MNNQIIEQLTKQTEQFTQQFSKQAETLFAGPFQAYAKLVVDHVEKLTAAQYEAAKAFTDVSLKQARAALEIRDQAGVQSYVESQQKVAKDLGERLQGDAQKIVSLNKDFAASAQKLVEGNVKNVQKAANKAA